MADRTALATLLQNQAVFNDDVRAGNNGVLERAVNGIRTGHTPRVWQDITLDQWYDALGTFQLSAADEARVQNFAARGNILPLSQSGVEAWVRDRVTDRAALDAVIAYAERDPTWAESEGVCAVGERASREDVRAALRDPICTKSFVNVRGTHPDARQVSHAEEDTIRTAVGAPAMRTGVTKTNERTYPIVYGGVTVQPGDTYTTARNPKNDYPPRLLPRGDTRTVRT